MKDNQITCYLKKVGNAWVAQEISGEGNFSFQHTSRQKAIAGILARHPGITSFTLLIPALKDKGEK